MEDCQIICPRHGAHFCLRTGEALTPPAYEPLRTFEVREENGRILVKRPYVKRLTLMRHGNAKWKDPESRRLRAAAQPPRQRLKPRRWRVGSSS